MGVRSGALAAALLMAAGLRAQTLVDGSRVPASLRLFDPAPGEQTLRCELRPLKPRLDFSLRFQTGYEIAVPMAQYSGPNHVWAIVTRVTPADGKPAWLLARVRLPDIPPTKIVSHTFGGFLVGPGRYRVDWALYDDQGRVSRAHWNIDARLAFGDRHVAAAIAPQTVADFAGTGLPPVAPPPAALPPLRLTVLLHAAPLNPRRTHLRGNDRLMLLSTLSALIEQARPTSVRLAVFNLDKQRVIYSSADFRLQSMVEVNRALNRLDLDTVAIATLARPRGHADLLASLIADEAASPKPSDAVIFLGPAARYLDKIPAAALPASTEGMRFYYFQCRPVTFQPAVPDIIWNATSFLKGRTIAFYTPGQFANAIRALGAR